jgi:hypothetical protein
MVRIEGPSTSDRLDALVRRLAAEHGLHLDVTGWARRTYDLYTPTVHARPGELQARIESFVTTSGEILVFDERALGFAQAFGAALERDFGIAEATITQRPRPS